jgi:hypothetical protein
LLLHGRKEANGKHEPDRNHHQVAERILASLAAGCNRAFARGYSALHVFNVVVCRGSLKSGHCQEWDV